MIRLVYVLCAMTSLWCAVLLLRAYARRGTRLLLWSGLCFMGLAVNNTLILIDLVVLADAIDLSILRAASGTVSVAVLLYGLIWDIDA